MIAPIKKVWDLAWDQWEHCNAILHEEQEAEDLHELAFIQAEIKWELKTGTGDIPLQKHFYFKMTYKELLNKILIFQGNWLEIILAARG